MKTPKGEYKTLLSLPQRGLNILAAKIIVIGKIKESRGIIQWVTSLHCIG